MKENLKIDINGSLKDAISKTVTETFGFLIFLAFVGVLIAPVFAPLFKPALEKHYDTNHVFENNEKVRNAYLKVKIALWIAAGLAWAFVLWCNS